MIHVKDLPFEPIMASEAETLLKGAIPRIPTSTRKPSPSKSKTARRAGATMGSLMAQAM
jgi:hypothetical protein